MNHSTRFDVIDTHTEGEATRVLLNGAPCIQAHSMQETKQVLMSHYDYIRRALIHEPRGHKDMFGAIVFPPVHAGSDVGVVFMDTGGYLNMCGHGSLGTVVALIEAGRIRLEEPMRPIRLDTPAGTIEVVVNTHHGMIQDLSLVNTPAFPYALSHQLRTGLNVDIAFGGNFFALVDMTQVHAHLPPHRNLVHFGMDILAQLNEDVRVQHPVETHIQSVDLVHFYHEAHKTSVVVFGDAQLDRSPCGTGMCAKMSVMYAKRALQEHEEFSCNSIIGTAFRGKILGTTQIGPYEAIIPQITGRAFVTGINTYVIDEHDPLKYGFSFHEKRLKEMLFNSDEHERLN